MGLSLERFRRRDLVRSLDPSVSIDEWASMFNQFGFGYQGVQYTLPASQQEQIAPQYASLAAGAMKANGVVFACMLVRMLLFSEARFQFRQVRNGRPGDLFGTDELGLLESPWPGATTGDLLSRMIQYADLAGNAFAIRRPGPRIALLRPDWVSLIIGSDEELDSNPDVWDVDAQVVGYMYKPGGPGSGKEPVFFLADEVAHFAPIPDPEARFRGMSWITPIVREVMADKAMTEFKLKFMENSATPQLAIKLDVPDLAKFKQWRDTFKDEHEGVRNAYKTLYLGAGADVTMIGKDLHELDFKVSQGGGETRVAAAAGVPPVIVGLSEGLQAATYSNYGQARRRFADGTMRPIWRNMAGSMARIVNVPAGAELWYDDRDIAALQEDRKDADVSASNKAATISSYIISGFKPDSVVSAVEANDLSRLVHTGLVSVQLFEPGAAPVPPDSPPPANGTNGKRSVDEALGELVRVAERNRKPVEIHNHLPGVDFHATVEPARTEIHNHIPEQEPPRLEIAEGAFRSETTVEPAQVTVPVTVEAAEPQHVTVEAARAPDVHVSVEPPPPAQVSVPVTVEAAEPARVDFHEGAFRSETTVEPAVVHVAAPNVQVEAPAPPDVNLTLEAARAPDVHVSVEPVEAPDVHVDVHVPEPPRPRNARAKREEDGSLTVSYDDEETPDAGSEPSA